MQRTFGVFVVLTSLTVFAFLLMGCDSSVQSSTSNKGESLEYANKEVSYAAGESCVERYLLYADGGTYERYIAGMYFGNRMPCVYNGTLFETGTYAVKTSSSTSESESESYQTIAFSPKKQYNFEKKYLDYLGLEDQIPYAGTLSEKTLTITWVIYDEYGFCKGEVPITYTRK